MWQANCSICFCIFNSIFLQRRRFRTEFLHNWVNVIFEQSYWDDPWPVFVIVQVCAFLDVLTFDDGLRGTAVDVILSAIRLEHFVKHVIFALEKNQQTIKTIKTRKMANTWVIVFFFEIIFLSGAFIIDWDPKHIPLWGI